MTPLTNAQKKLLGKLDSRHGRSREGRFLAEGVRCCAEALERAGSQIEAIVATEAFLDSRDWLSLRPLADRLGLAPATADAREFAAWAETDSPQGILCLVRYPESLDDTVSPPADPFVLVLDRLQDPGNLGTVLRTAWAVGLKEVWMTKGTTDPFAPKAIRAGMGAQFALRLRRFDDLEAAWNCLQAHGYPRLWLAGPRAQVSVFDSEFDLRRAGIVIGNEANGIEDDRFGTWVTIPMPGQAESLNAAQAATVFLFDAVRRGILR